MHPLLISASGQFASGKDNFCDYLHNKLDNHYGKWYREALANNVKRIYCETFGVDRDFIEKWKRVDDPPPGFDMPVRKGLTFIGDGFREIRNSIWIDSLLSNNKRQLIISDARYVNEINYFRSHNGITVLLWRPGHENQFPNRSEQELMPFVHRMKSEPDGIVSVDEVPFDLWIKNDGTLEDLHNKIDKLVVPFVNRKLCQ